METFTRLYDECDDHTFVLFTMALQAVGDKQYKRRPRVAWRFPLSAGGQEYVEVRPGYRSNEEDKKHHDELFAGCASLGLGDGESDWSPMDEDTNYQVTQQDQFRLVIAHKGKLWHIPGLVLDSSQSFLMLTWSKYYYYPEWTLERAVEAAKAVIERPAELMALESSHCCLCRKPLRVAESVAKGYGPCCAKRFGLEWSAGMELSK